MKNFGSKAARAVTSLSLLAAIALAPGERPTSAVDAGSTTVVPMVGVSGIPADAGAVAMNVTVTNAAAPGYVTAYPCGSTRPATSSVNYLAGDTVANFAVVDVGEGGAVCFYSKEVVDLIVDVQGWFPSGSFSALARPERFVDTRETNGAAAGSTMQVPMVGQSGIPSDAGAVAMNVTVTNAAAPGYVRAYPCSGSGPGTSSLNYLAGDTVANFAVVDVGDNGAVCFFSKEAVDLIVDVQGWVQAGSFSPLAQPERFLDTRLATAAAAGSTTQVSIVGESGIPADAGAVAMNVTVTNAAAPGFVTAYPCGSTRPLTSSVNYLAGDTVANFAVVDVGEGGAVCLYTKEAVDLIVDVQGWVPSGSFSALAQPERFLDTRDTPPPGEPPTDPPGTPPPGNGPPAPVTNSPGDFVATFDNDGGGELLRQGVYHRNVGTQELGGPVEVFPGIGASEMHGGTWSADHDMACNDPSTQRELSSDNYGDGTYDFHVETLQFACRNHWMTSMGDVDGYSIVWFAPDQEFTREGQRTVSWDVNVTDLRSRKWWEVSIVPVGGEFLSTADWLAQTTGLPMYGDDTIVVANGGGGPGIRITTDRQERYDEGGAWIRDLDPEGFASKSIRRTFSITDNGNGTLTVNYGGMFTQTVPGSFPERFQVYFKDHNYTPDKDGVPMGHTWHWDNIAVI